MCIVYEAAPEECIGRAYEMSDGTTHAFAPDGRPLSRFRFKKLDDRPSPAV
jgi:hypothetical protein